MSGSAVISALAVLENPRLDGNKGKNVLFDGHVFFYDDPTTSDHASLVLLRYFNDSNHIFDEVGRYFIQANISVIDKNIPSDKLSKNMELSDYVLAGDIVQIIPLPDDTSPHHRPYINIIGIITAFNQETHTFELSPEVYTGLKAKGSKAILPVCCFVPNTRRWENKPVAKVGHYIGVSGFLHSVNRDSSGMATRFQVEIEHITYLPRPYVPLSSAPSSTSGLAAGSSTPPGKRLRFSYADSSPPLKKPRLNDQGASESH